MIETYWSLDLSPVRLLAAALLALVALALSLQQYRRGGHRPLEAWAEAVRLIAVLLLGLTFLRPEQVRIHREEGLPALGVLIDVTDSMATVDVESGDEPIARRAWTAPWLEPEAWSSLAERYRVQRHPFGHEPLETDGDPQPGTDLHTPLDDWARREGAARALLVISDGDWTAGPSPVEAATRLRAADTPVFTVTVGADRFLPDVELLPVRAPVYTQIGEQAHLPFVIQSRMPARVETTVLLYEDDRERARLTVTVPPMAQTAASISFVPDQEGEFTYRLQVLPVPGEHREDNNTQTFAMAVRREIVRMLIIETEPRWEYRYLRNAAVRDPNVEVHTLLFHPGLPAGGGKHYLPAFPASREALARYDVVFVGDVAMGAGGLSEEQCEQLRDLVIAQAAGLVFLPGPSGRWTSLADGPLGELLPVEPEPEHPRGHGIDIAGRLALTTLGRDHRLTRLASTPEGTGRVWDALPGFFWYAGVQRAKPGAEILAVHAHARNEDGRIPLVVSMTAGNGKVLFMGHDSAWRWRRGVEDLYHYRFWSQVFRWMSHQRHLAHAEGVRFFFSPETPLPGDRLWVQATPLDAQGFPLEGSTVEGILRTPAGQAYTFALTEREGVWGSYQGHAPVRESGPHTLTVRVRETGREAEVTFHAAAPDLEPVGRPARHEVLRELAAITGGQAVRAQDMDDLIETLRDLPPRRPAESRFRLWAHPGWLALLTGLFGLYWTLRKVLGRI